MTHDASAHSATQRPQWRANRAPTLANARDPTQTTVLRREYARRLRGEFDGLITAIRTGIIDRDVFGLQANANPPPSFRFERDSRKTTAFMDWLDREVQGGVLQTISRNQNPYVRQAYQRGLDHADRELAKQGIAIPPGQDHPFAVPKHRDSLQLLYTRNYQQLQGITQTMDQQVSRVLTDGFAQGRNPRAIARDITGRVSAIGKTRATVLARTEVINAHATSTLNRYEDFDAQLQGVAVTAEFQTAGDRRVCDECQSLEGNVYTLKEARGLIPVHAQCRCALLPITS